MIESTLCDLALCEKKRDRERSMAELTTQASNINQNLINKLKNEAQNGGKSGGISGGVQLKSGFGNRRN